MKKATPFYIITLLFCAPMVWAGSLTLDNQRETFVAAEKAAKHGDFSEYNRLKASLKEYPLYHYLLYNDMIGNLDRHTEAQIENFLHQYADSPLADRLRAKALKRFAQQGAWRSYAKFYAAVDSTESQCLYLRALMETGRKTEMLNSVEPLWLTGKSMPSSCDPVFDAWRSAGRLTTDLVWGRIELAMDEKHGSKLASYLGRYLSGSDKSQLELWLKVDTNPALVTSTQLFTTNNPIRQKILAHGIKRLTKVQDIDASLAAWRKIKSKYPFDDAEITSIEKHIALNLMWEDDKRALTFLNQMNPLHRDEKLLDTGVREAVGLQAWDQLITLVGQTAEKDRDEYHRYWYGRALEKSGKFTEATVIFSELAKERTYHGFIAADRIGADYNVDNVPLRLAPELLGKVENTPAVQRARELFALRRMVDARREWYKLVKSMETDELQAFSKLAQGWGWHSRAIFTLAKTDYWDDLDLRFPLEHKRHIDPIAEGRELDISWVFAVVRQESAFIPDARSPSGAMGLMQLMPATAREVAHKLNIKKPKTHDLLQPNLNVTLGTSYLRQMLDRLYQHPILATAAYNAGPHRVQKWLPEGTIPADEWVATIPFNETREYVERILSYTVIYDTRRGFKPRRLSDSMMDPIGKGQTEAISVVTKPRPGAG